MTKEELREKVGIAIGQASMCWMPSPSGVFDSSAAEGVLETLMEDIETWASDCQMRLPLGPPSLL